MIPLKVHLLDVGRTQYGDCLLVQNGGGQFWSMAAIPVTGRLETGSRQFLTNFKSYSVIALRSE